VDGANRRISAAARRPIHARVRGGVSRSAATPAPTHPADARKSARLHARTRQGRPVVPAAWRPAMRPKNVASASDRPLL
jgi:hypothetical protein